MLLTSAYAAVFVATGGDAILSVHTAQHVPAAQRSLGVCLFVVCYQLGGALRPSLATVFVLA
ncbi:hypothetical protein ABCR94_17735 [Streptomyces sp. 21So2-11]|uniref:hypothetical protein n=1 Tax=Streptomyces sp. 21So2-11 TaxID=3144408 RepID=UPI0032198488